MDIVCAGTLPDREDLRRSLKDVLSFENAFEGSRVLQPLFRGEDQLRPHLDDAVLAELLDSLGELVGRALEPLNRQVVELAPARLDEWLVDGSAASRHIGDQPWSVAVAIRPGDSA